MSDDTVTIDGKNYLKSDIISKCSPTVPTLEGKPINKGDKFIIEDQEYIVACLSSSEMLLICLDGGNRYSDTRSEHRCGEAKDLKMFSGSHHEAKRVTK